MQTDGQVIITNISEWHTRGCTHSGRQDRWMYDRQAMGLDVKLGHRFDRPKALPTGR